MDIASIIGLVLLGIMAAFCVFSALFGLIRGLKKTLGSTIVIIVSAIIAFIVTAIAFKPTPEKSAMFADALLNLLGPNTDISDIIAMPGAADAVNYYVTLLISPFIFVILFVLIRLILGIIMKIVVRFIPLLNNIPKVAKRLGGLGVGLANGFILCLILFMPLLGTVNLANDALIAIENTVEKADQAVENGDTAKNNPYVVQLSQMSGEPESEEGSAVDGISEIRAFIAPVVEGGTGKVMLTFGGKIMYNGLTSAEYYGEKMQLSSEIDIYANMAGGILAATEEEKEADQIVGLVDSIAYGVEKSPMVKGIMVGVTSEMASAWMEGESYLGISKISVNETIDPMIDTVIGVLATESRETIHADLVSVSGFLKEAGNCGLLDISGDSGDIIDKFATEGTLSAILGTIDTNERLLPLIDELNHTCIRLVAENLDVAMTHQENYDRLMLDLAQAAKEYFESHITEEEERRHIIEVFESHGIEMTDEEAQNMSMALMSQFGEYYDDMNLRIEESFILYNAVRTNSYTTDMGTISVNGRLLNYFNAYTLEESQPYILAMNGTPIGGAATLYSAESMESVLITAEDILNLMVDYADIDDRHGESVKIDAVMVAMAHSYQNIADGNMHASELMSEMGVVLDNMKGTHVYGELTTDFLIAIMQSPKVSDSLGLNIVEMTDFANKINNGLSENTSYHQISVTVSHSFDVLESINKGESNKDSVTALLNDLTPETAKVMQEIATPELMQNYGVKKEYAEKSCNAVGTLFGNMADYTANHPQADGETLEEYNLRIEKEADATDKIITLALKANEEIDSKQPLFHTNGAENGALGMGAYDVVDLFVSSTVAEDTVSDLVYDETGVENKFDPLGIQSGLLENDKTEIENALDEYKAQNSDKEGIDQKLENIGSLFGINYKAN